MGTPNEDIILKAQRGLRLPYSKYAVSVNNDILAHKRNNAAAIVVCADSVSDLCDEKDSIEDKTLILNAMCEEIMKYCSYGLIGIGYFGIVVENGKPARIDSTGKNISKLYGSVYDNISIKDYSEMSRIDSMLLDQKEERRFNKFLEIEMREIEQTLVPLFKEFGVADSCIRKCLGLDEMFCKLYTICKTNNCANTYGTAISVAKQVNKLIEPYRYLLEDDNVANLRGYTMTDMKPIVHKRKRRR